MSHEQPHINPWADKLQQAPLPDADASWKGMEHLLDQHMPVEEKEKKRCFFFLLWPVLLLLIGTGVWMMYRYSVPQSQAQQGGGSDGSPDVIIQGGARESLPLPKANSAAASAPERAQAENGKGTDTAGYTYSGSSIPAVTTANADKEGLREEDKEGTQNQSTTSAPIRSSVNAKRAGKQVLATGENISTNVNDNVNQQPINKKGERSPTAREKKRSISKGTSVDRDHTTTAKQGTQKSRITGVTTAGLSNNSAASVTAVDDRKSALVPALPPFRNALNPLQQLAIQDSISPLRHSLVSDSLLQALKKKKGETQKKGWTVGVGVNHFMRVNNQQAAPYKGDPKTADSEGLTGKVADYLPVPQAQYHFNNKLFVQGELQFNAPQFTQPVQLEQRRYLEGQYMISDTAYLKKLTYINLPLSVHYRPFRRVFVGGGVQFSRLSNAIVLHETTRVQVGAQFPDSIKTSKQVRIKNDTLFQKLHTAELRLLGDVSYQAGRFTVGLRYNQALRGLVKVPVAGSSFTQARNSSLQLYLRYRFLDKRKEVQPKSK